MGESAARNSELIKRRFGEASCFGLPLNDLLAVVPRGKERPHRTNINQVS